MGAGTCPLNVGENPKIGNKYLFFGLEFLHGVEVLCDHYRKIKKRKKKKENHPSP